MNIAIASDHAGLESKKWIMLKLGELGYTVNDLGCHSTGPCDYSEFAILAAESVVRGENDAAILICGTGIGMSIAANKVKGILAAVVYSEKTAVLAKQHNKANVLCLGARQFSRKKLLKFINIWLKAEFAGHRHEQRIAKIKMYEKLTGDFR